MTPVNKRSRRQIVDAHPPFALLKKLMEKNRIRKVMREGRELCLLHAKHTSQDRYKRRAPRQTCLTPGFSARCDHTVKQKSPSSAGAILQMKRRWHTTNVAQPTEHGGALPVTLGEVFRPAITKSVDSFPCGTSQLWCPVPGVDRVCKLLEARRPLYGSCPRC